MSGPLICRRSTQMTLLFSLSLYSGSTPLEECAPQGARECLQSGKSPGFSKILLRFRDFWNLNLLEGFSIVAVFRFRLQEMLSLVQGFSEELSVPVEDTEGARAG